MTSKKPETTSTHSPDHDKAGFSAALQVENTLKALYDLYGRSLQSEYAITYTSPSRLRDGVSRSLQVRLSPAAGSPGRFPQTSTSSQLTGVETGARGFGRTE
mgnify:CR=1 FL=1